MTGSLRTRLTAATTAAALALGGLTLGAAPAAARSNDQTLGWILGLGAAAVLLHELDKENSKPRVPTITQVPPRDPWRHDDHRDDWRRDSRLEVPNRCLIDVRTGNGHRQVVLGSCAEREMYRAELPRACAFDLITNYGRRERVYGRNCLEDRGYRISRY